MLPIQETIPLQILGSCAELCEVSHIFTAHGSNAQIVAWINERSSAQDTLIGLGATSSRRDPAFVNRNVSLEAGRFSRAHADEVNSRFQVLALFGPAAVSSVCLLSGDEQTNSGRSPRSRFDPGCVKTLRML